MKKIEDSVMPRIVEMARQIQKKFKTSDDQSLTLDGTLYDEFLPNGLDANILVMLEEFNQHVVGAYMIAFGDVLMGSLYNQPDKDETAITVPLSPAVSVEIKAAWKPDREKGFVVTGRMVYVTSTIDLDVENNEEEEKEEDQS